MGTIAQALAFWTRFDPLVLMANIIQDHPNIINDKIRNQLLAGITGDGSKLRPYKDKRYATNKHERNPLPGFGTPDFKLTGETHREIFTVVDEVANRLITGSAAEPSKVQFLIGRDGIKIFKLTDANRPQVKAELQRLFFAELSRLSGCPVKF